MRSAPAQPEKERAHRFLDSWRRYPRGYVRAYTARVGQEHMNTPTVADAGCEYVVDAFGCAPSRLASLDHLVTLIERLIADLDLRVVHAPLWHVFDGSGGVTGLILLAESHIAVHTFPERGFAAFNLYHCRSAPEWPWDRRLTDSLAAEQVVVRTLMRGQGVGSHEASAG